MIVVGTNQSRHLKKLVFLMLFSTLLLKTEGQKGVEIQARVGYSEFKKFELKGVVSACAITFQPAKWMALTTELSVSNASKTIIEEPNFPGIQIEHNSLSEFLWFRLPEFKNNMFSFGIGGFFTYTSLVNGTPKTVQADYNGTLTQVIVYENQRVTYLVGGYLLGAEYRYLFRNNFFIGLDYRYSPFMEISSISLLIGSKRLSND